MQYEEIKPILDELKSLGVRVEDQHGQNPTDEDEPHEWIFLPEIEIGIVFHPPKAPTQVLRMAAYVHGHDCDGGHSELGEIASAIYHERDCVATLAEDSIEGPAATDARGALSGLSRCLAGEIKELKRQIEGRQTILAALEKINTKLGEVNAEQIEAIPD